MFSQQSHALNSGPDPNGKAKLEQLLVLQSLHELYEAGRLRKCLLSMYLKLTEHHRLDVISKLEKYCDGELDTPPKIPRRLAKLPHVFKVLADRGFDGDNLSYSFFNIVVTPEFLEHKQNSLRCPNWNGTERFVSSGTHVRWFSAE